MGLFGRKKTQPTAAAGPAGEVTLEDGATYQVSQVVDCIGDSCPRPQLMTKKALASAATGDVIEVRIDNPTSMEAIPPMMPELNSTYIGTLKADRYWRVIVRRQ
ncbi:sulfurtransferase TusA family protein [Sedimenticola hydrogenitrophicus]|uniref:sulfurtransferase TusA family protein n=1 Tax=Sedimenticola hydrogenitrophicus TaxID=2967975 RepID=UPI0023B1D876|nr:sulfurtransferase TusA family protein [Sedimenticola hydrogenitrophicus]